MGALISVFFLLYTSYVVAQTGQDNALCGFIAATDVKSISGYGNWICNTNGITTSDPCIEWEGLACNGSSVESIKFLHSNLAGNTFYRIIPVK